MADSESKTDEVEIVEVLGSGWFKFVRRFAPPMTLDAQPPQKRKRTDSDNKVFFELTDEIQK